MLTTCWTDVDSDQNLAFAIKLVREDWVVEDHLANRPDELQEPM